MSRGRPLVGVGCVGVLLAAAYLGGRLLDGGAHRRVAVEAERAARDAAARAKDALAAQAESVSVLAHNAIVNPPLVAALRARVDRRTLGDLFASESWWAPYRFFDSAVSYNGSAVAFAQLGTRGLPLDRLVAQVRAGGEPTSTVLAGETRAHLASAVAIPLSVSQPPAVLVLTKPLDREALRSVADRSGSSVLVSDGQRALGRFGDDAALLDAALQRPGRPDPAWASSSVRLAPGLSLWVGASVADFARAEAAADRRRKLSLWGAAGVLSLPILYNFLRRPRPSRSHGRLRAPSPGPLAHAVVSPRPRGRLERPTTLGRYLLVDRIGEGGMAEVFTAVSFGAEGFRRSFVVKRLRPEMAGNPSAVAHFIEEANTMSKLVHPNIVPVFDFGEVGGAFFIAEEHIVGRDLARLSARLVELGRPPLSVNAVLYVIHEILSGLMYVHAAGHGSGTPIGFVHRDVSPQNVMISRIGDVKLLDFGIMKANHGVSTTDIGTVKGNVDFMSPEQARGRAVDQRSDLFSVGLVLYHCLAREALYRGDTLYDRLSRAANGPGPDELARVAALPEPICRLLRTALEIDPARRFQTAVEFRSAVAAHVTGGEAELAALVSELFGDELQAELDHLSAVIPPARVAEQPDRKSG
jgi:hypothetical protein